MPQEHLAKFYLSKFANSAWIQKSITSLICLYAAKNKMLKFEFSMSD